MKPTWDTEYYLVYFVTFATQEFVFETTKWTLLNLQAVPKEQHSIHYVTMSFPPPIAAIIQETDKY